MRAFNVLVIDDDPSICQLLEKLLADRPRYRMLIAGNGPEALRCLTQERVDVVLSDIYMPGFTGLDLLKDMQKVNIRPEILIMTANATPENVETARALGARSMLIKPFDDLAVVEDEIEKAVKDVEARGAVPAPPKPAPPKAAPPEPAPSGPAPLPGPGTQLEAEAYEAIEVDADAPVEDDAFEIVDEPAPPALPDFDAWKTAIPAVAAPEQPAPASIPTSRPRFAAQPMEVAPPHEAKPLAPPVRDLLLLPGALAPEESGHHGASFDDPAERGPAAPEPAPAPSPIGVAPSGKAHQEIKEWAEPAPETAAWAEPDPVFEAAPEPPIEAAPEAAPPAPAGTADIPHDLAEILRMDEIIDLERMKIQVPIICLQTWEEETAVASLRAVCASLKREFHCWSAASGIVREGGAPMGDAYRDPTRALEFIRRQKRRALYVLADFRRHLEDPAVVRVLREMVMARETVLALLVLTAPELVVPPELARVTAVFEWPAFDGLSLRMMFEEIRKDLETSSGRKIDLDSEESEALLSVMVEMPAARARFEITRALMALMNRG
jgi:CheY-like chemotaxis protein